MPRPATCRRCLIPVPLLVAAALAMAQGTLPGRGPDAPLSGVTAPPAGAAPGHAAQQPLDLVAMLFVFMLATFIGIGVIRRVSRLLHTPLMSLTNAISGIAVVGSIMVAGGEQYPPAIRLLGAVALFASMTNIISGFLITNRMLKMFKTPARGTGSAAPGGRP